jgi:transcription initiation factor TFIIIB Brf1 subunit/transcription initiation factor TFIIB
LGIEKLAIEIEEIANGVYPSDKPQQVLLISKAKKIQQLARRRKGVVAARVESMVCTRCDLRMTLEEVAKRYRVFVCKNCKTRVGVL